MRYFRTGVLGAALFFCVFTPVVAQTNTTEEAYQQTLLTLIATLQQQIELLQRELAARVSDDPWPAMTTPIIAQESETLRFSDSDSVSVIGRYDLTEGSSHRMPYEQHEVYLERIFTLFPDEYEAQISEFIVFAGEDSNFDAFVETIPPQHEQWSYAVNREIIDDPNSSYNTDLIVHELAHVFGYEEIPGTSAPRQSECDEYFAQTGCPRKNSYIRTFIDQFWSKDDLRRTQDFTRSQDPISAAEEYYEHDEHEYVSAYAAVSPEEDFAESFLHYVLKNPPERGEARQKVEFFGVYDELQNMRTEIRRAR